MRIHLVILATALVVGGPPVFSDPFALVARAEPNEINFVSWSSPPPRPLTATDSPSNTDYPYYSPATQVTQANQNPLGSGASPTDGNAVPLAESPAAPSPIPPLNAVVEGLNVGNDSPSNGMIVFVGYDAFRGIADGNWENNGIHAGVNFGTCLGSLSDGSGIGFQIGGSMGVYDWSGTDYRAQNEYSPQTQEFLTYGFFRRATDGGRWSAGLVNDWMFNSNFGVYAADPILTQFRGQITYALSESDELGVWGTCRGNTSTRPLPYVGSGSYRAVNLLSAYWHHHWLFGGDTWLLIGAPDNSRITHQGSLGSYYVSASATLPLNNVMSIYTNVMYMAPSAAPGDAGSNENAWNFTVGLAFYPGRNARSTSVKGQSWMPLLPVANNGSFLVDASQWY